MMREVNEVEEACERAAKMHSESQRKGSQYSGMTYEDGLREAFDWIMENIDEDPTVAGI